jgi:hypothetical protein
VCVVRGGQVGRAALRDGGESSAVWIRGTLGWRLPALDATAMATAHDTFGTFAFVFWNRFLARENTMPISVTWVIN